MNLKELRNKIDQIDKGIVQLLNKRARLSLKIGQIKRKNKREVFAPDREKAIYRRISSLNKGPFSDFSLKSIYREIMSGSLNLEKSLTVSYLGPEATFTHLASLKKFGTSIKYKPCNSITDVFTEVERSRCDYGVVPVENSVEGMVNHTLDMFIESDLKICSEVSLNISHNLLSNCPINKVKKVYSNPQVFGQCRLWLESNLPGRELIEVSSTTKAALYASREKDVAAAIASELAGRLYKLKTIARSIEDSQHNITRFLIIGKTLAKPTGRDKTSIMFSVKDRVGALHAMLTPFKKNNINLTKIESRPSKKKAWQYYFFVDLEGHCQEKKVTAALNSLEKGCQYLKILGSYPVEG
jgi:chorismate mutase/prephenate dehydratase